MRVVAMRGITCCLVLSCATAFAIAATVTVPGDYTNVQAAINSAGDGDEVVIQPGTYHESINFRGKAITVRSIDPDDPEVVQTTVVDAQDQSNVVVFISGEGRDSVLSGLTVTNGRAAPGGRGGGIYCHRSSPTIRHNRITGNRADGDVASGGGILCLQECSPLISHNAISNNSAGFSGGGLSLREGGNPEITDNIIEHNSAGLAEHGTGRGGGIFCDEVQWHIANNQFRENTIQAAGAGAGICCDGGSGIIANNQITANRALERASGGGVYIGGAVALTRVDGNEISGNAAGNYGGGIAVISDLVIVSENAIVGNSAARAGGVSCVGNTTVSHNLIQGNAATDSQRGRGGGIECPWPGGRASPVISQNRILENWALVGAGIACFGPDASPTIRNNVIAWNGVPAATGADSLPLAGGGISLVARCAEEGPTGAGRPSILSNTITHNAALFGGAIQAYGAGPLIYHNIIAFSHNGGGLYMPDCDATISYSNVYGNQDPDDDELGDYFFVEDQTGIAGNISEDPLFADPDAHDFHLRSEEGRWHPDTEQWVQDGDSSPCIDAGHPQGHCENEPAPNGSRPNLGAYANTAEASKSRAVPPDSGPVVELTPLEPVQILRLRPILRPR